MIKKIKKIHYKSFDNYDMSGFEFKRINLIYGLNGMGKSSLINFIKDNIENKKLDVFETSYNDFNIFFYDVKYKDSLFYSNDKFKTFYIADDIENLILEKNKLIDKKGNLEKLSSRIENKLNEINKKQNDLKSTIAKNAREVLNKIDNLKYNTPQSYASNHVNIEQFNDNDLLSNEELDKIKTKSKNISYEYIKEFNFNKFKQIELSIKEFNKMLKQTPENNAIERFKLDNDLEKLAKLAFDIKNKLKIYKDKCPLCEQNILGIKLWEKLEKHFNEEYKQFIERLDRAKVFFENSIKELNDCTKWFNEYFIKTKLLIDDNIDQKRQEYLELIEKSVNEINKIIKCLEFKQQNPNKDNFSIEVNVNLFKKILGDEIYNVIKQHNNKQQTYIKDIDENIEKVKRHFVVAEKDKILSYRNLVGIYNKIKDKIECVSKKRKEQINDIDEKLKEMDRSFQNLNDDINDWFFKDICFEKIGDTHYKIQRLNCNDEWFECDEGLSEGEKTIVSIIYFVNHFLSKIKEIRECPIILLDDPINSLDNSNRDKIVNYIYEKMLNQDRGQFFISTHIDEICFKFDKILIDNNKKDKKTIFEIHKISKKSQVYMKEKFVLNNEFNTIYDRLKKFLEIQQYEDIFNIKDDIRFILEKICSIFFDNTNNFTNNYNDLLGKINICKKYTANDIQDLNHGKFNLNNDEVISKVQFVTEIIDRIRETNQWEKL